MRIADSIASTRKWITFPLGSAGIWTGGGTPSTNHREYWDNGTIPWVSPKDMKSCKILETIDSITEKALSQSTAKLIPNNSVLIVVRSGILKRMLPVAIAKVDVTTNQDLQSITPSKGILSAFLYWSLVANSDQIRSDCAKDGTTVDSVDVLKLKSFLIKVPPLPEQRAIVAKIESLFSELDAGVASLETAKAQLKVYRQAVLTAAFSNISGEMVKIDLLGSHIEKIEAGNNMKCEERPPREGEIGVVKISAVTWGTFDEEKSKTPPSSETTSVVGLIKEGDFLISRANTIELVGSCVIVKRITKSLMLSDKVLRIVLKKDVDPRYLLYFMRSPIGRKEIESRATGNQLSMRNITQGNLKSIPFFMKSLSEQSHTVSEIESRLSLADKLEETIDASLAQAASLRQSILKQAFEGKLLSQEELEACRHEPDWESAEQLLERIKAERAASGEGNVTAAQRKRAGKRSRAS